MRKILSFVFVCLLAGGTALQAAPVSGSRALDIAKKIFAAQPATKSGSGQVKLIWDGEEVATKGVQPAFYVFGRDGGGFVIIAGDDNVTPVLAISDHNEFKVEGMPDNVRWWMERMKAYVRASAQQTPEIGVQWDKYVGTKSDNARITGTVTDKVEKLTPEWDQGVNDPYFFGEGVHVFNKKCPLDGTEYSAAGCLPTALAELLTYQSGQAGVDMPASASGTVGGYTPESGCVAPAAYSLGTTYKWSELRTLTNIAAVKAAVDANNTALLDNLAQLIADLGAMVEASYSQDETSAAISKAIDALIAHMGFNKGAYNASESSYTERKWIALLKAELDKRPLIYSGCTTDNAGHAFIFDGYGKYEGTDVFHVNFGWGGGDCNGYYYNTCLDSGYGDFSYYCRAIFDFYPNPSSTYPANLEAYYDNEDWPGISYDGYYLYYVVLNMGSQQYDGQVKLCLKKKDGTETVLATDDIAGMAQYSLANNYIEIGEISPVNFGDKIVCYYQDGSEWKLLGGSSSAVSEWPLMPAAFIKTEESYSVNDYFTFALTNHDCRYAGTKWTFTDPDGNTTGPLKQSQQEFQFTKKGTWKIEAAVAPTKSGAVTETIVTYIKVN